MAESLYLKVLAITLDRNGSLLYGYKDLASHMLKTLKGLFMWMSIGIILSAGNQG